MVSSDIHARSDIPNHLQVSTSLFNSNERFETELDVAVKKAMASLELDLTKLRTLKGLEKERIEKLSKDCPHLQSLDFSKYPLSDETLKIVCQNLTSLQNLAIQGKTFSTKEIFPEENQLEKLSLLHCTLNNLDFLKPLRHLKAIDLRFCSLSEKQHEVLISFLPQGLLTVGFQGISDRILQDLVKKFFDLCELKLPFNKITKVGLEALLSLKNLKLLDLSGSVLNDGFELIAQLTELHTLDLSSCRIKETALQAFTTLKELRFLSLKDSRCMITKKGFIPLADNLLKLEFLDLERIDLETESLLSLVRLKNLKLLHLNSKQIKMVDLSILFAFLKNLESLNISETNGDLKKEIMPNLSQLTYLSLGEITDQTAEMIGTYLPKLESLTFKGRGVTDRGLIAMAEGCRELKYLEISDCTMTQASFESFALNLKNLEEISINFPLLKNEDSAVLTFLSLLTHSTTGNLSNVVISKECLTKIKQHYSFVRIHDSENGQTFSWGN